MSLDIISTIIPSLCYQPNTTLNVVVTPFWSFLIWILNGYKHNVQKFYVLFFIKYYVKQSSVFLHSLLINLFCGCLVSHLVEISVLGIYCLATNHSELSDLKQ